MNTIIRNAMGIAITVSVLLVGLGVYHIAGSYAQSRDQLTNRSFTVTAEGKAVAVPDVARFTYAVVSQGGTDVARVQEENTKKANTVMAYLKEAGVEEKDIRTVSYRVEPEYVYTPCEAGRPCQPPAIQGYSVRNQVEVRVRNFDRVGGMLGGVVQRGANSVSQVSFTVDDPTAAETLAKEEAVKKALVKARSLAKAADFDVGDILSIDEGYSVSPYPMYAKSSFGMADMATAEAAPAPSIAPGSEEVVRTVTVRFAIE
jgi:uncharacterized protein